MRFKAGRWQSRYQYKSFEPMLLNHDWQWEDATINVLLENANQALAELLSYPKVKKRKRGRVEQAQRFHQTGGRKNQLSDQIRNRN